MKKEQYFLIKGKVLDTQREIQILEISYDYASYYQIGQVHETSDGRKWEVISVEKS